MNKGAYGLPIGRARIGRTAGHVFLDEWQASGGNAGASGAGSWDTRVLNRKSFDTNGDCRLLSTGSFMMKPGTYEISAKTCCVNATPAQARIYNLTDALTIMVGPVPYVGSGSGPCLHVGGVFTIPSDKEIVLQLRVNAGQGTYGRGIANSFGEVEVYSTAYLRRLR